jgi:hypothetical protein
MKLAYQELKNALAYDPYNVEIKNLYEKLKNDIDQQSKGEKKVFKSFFRNVNKIYEDNSKEEPQKSDIGKAEVKLLGL